MDESNFGGHPLGPRGPDDSSPFVNPCGPDRGHGCAADLVDPMSYAVIPTLAGSYHKCFKHFEVCFTWVRNTATLHLSSSY